MVDPRVCYGGLPGIGEKMPVHKDYVYATKHLTTRSMRPIHQMTLDIEHLRLAQAICLARQFCELRQICYTRVDAIYFQPAKCQANAAKKAFEEITYDKLHEIHFKPHARGQGHLVERQLRPNDNQAKVYRIGPVTAEVERKATFGAKYDLQVVTGSLEVPPARPWNDYIEGDIVAEEKAMEIVMANQSLFVQGLWQAQAKQH